jgi:hypothetical protein
MAGHWSVYVSGNWRLTFAFEDEDAILVDYQDYHQEERWGCTTQHTRRGLARAYRRDVGEQARQSPEGISCDSLPTLEWQLGRLRGNGAQII